MKITVESAENARKEAKWAYNHAMEKFYYSMLEVVFLRIKSHLNYKGLQKVKKIDQKRADNENLGVEFSQKTWMILEEAWVGAESLAMNKIADLYGLEKSDLDLSKIQKLNQNDSMTNYTP